MSHIFATGFVLIIFAIVFTNCETSSQQLIMTIDLNGSNDIENPIYIPSMPKKVPPEYRKFVNSWYKYHIDPKKWSHARRICEAEGGYLAIINSAAEADFLRRLMEEFPPSELPNTVTHKDNIFIGFHDLFEDNEYLTVESKPLAKTGYFLWVDGKPTNSKGENCGSFHRRGGLVSHPCAALGVFVCEISPDTNCVFSSMGYE